MTAPGYERIAEAICHLAAAPLREPVAHAARRTLFNVLTVALGAAAAPQVTRLAAVVAADAGVPVAPGVAGRADVEDAALVTGFAAHLDDFDDTHLATVIHPGAAGLGAAWATGPATRRTGPDLVAAFAIGIELQLRLGAAVSPEHYDRGWHITGTCGVVGAAATAGLLYRLTPDALADALRMASVQTVGHREAFGTEVKPFHAGKAAANGVTAARQARGGVFSDLADCGPLLRALAPATHGARHRRDELDLLDGFGSRWELSANTFKPYPCGIVAHPGIDAAVRAHQEGVDPAQIAAVRYRCHPLVSELMGRADPRTGLQARFSAVHGVAAGLLTGDGGLAQFSDDTTNDPAVRALRARIALCPDGALPRNAAGLSIELDGGGVVEVNVEHARGSLERPLTDDELIDKAEALVPGQARRIWAAVAGLADPESSGSLPDLLATASGQVQSR